METLMAMFSAINDTMYGLEVANQRTKKLRRKLTLVSITAAALLAIQEIQIKKLEDEVYILNRKVDKLDNSEEE